MMALPGGSPHLSTGASRRRTAQTCRPAPDGAGGRVVKAAGEAPCGWRRVRRRTRMVMAGLPPGEGVARHAALVRLPARFGRGRDEMKVFKQVVVYVAAVVAAVAFVVAILNHGGAS